MVKRITSSLKLVIVSKKKVNELAPQDLILGKGANQKTPNALLNP
jgi:hypothetical protein